MNTLLAWFNSPDWMIVVKTLLHTLWQAGGLALLLWITLRRVANPAVRYRLTLGTLAAILGTTLLTWAVLNQSTPTPAALDFASTSTPARKPSGDSPAANFGEPSVIAYATPIAKPAEEVRWSGWLALAWLLGTALMLTRAGIQVAGAERLRRSCKPLEDSRITQLLAEAQHALNLTQRIRVAVTDKLTSPAVVGVIVPTLILPLTLLTTLTPEQIRFILLHELAHIRRGDYFANLFQLFIETLLFFNPAVWWISHQVRREREACCDALAIELSGAPVDYARTLLHVAETVLNPPPTAATAFSDNQREPSSLTDRVQRLLVPGYRPALRLTWRAMLAAIVVGGTLLFFSAVGARNVVGAVSTNSSAKMTETATNVLENAVFTASDSGTNSRNTSTRQVASASLGGVSIFELNNDGWIQPGYGFVPDGEIYMPSRVNYPVRPIYKKSGDYEIKLSNYSNSHAPVVQLGILNQRDTESFYHRLGSWSAQPSSNYISPGKLGEGRRAHGKVASRLLENKVGTTNERAFAYGSNGEIYLVSRFFGMNRRVFEWSGESPTQAVTQMLPLRFSTEKAGADKSFPQVLDKGRKGILQRLDHIQLDNFSCDKLPLSEVLYRISERVREFDPTEEGINFKIQQATVTVSGTNTLASVADIPITIGSNHKIAHVGTILYHIAKGAATPVEYSIEDRSVVFRLKESEIKSAEETYNQERWGWHYSRAVTNVVQHNANIATKAPNGEPLTTRRYRFDSNMIAQAFGIVPKVGGSAGLNSTNLALTKSGLTPMSETQIKQSLINTFKSIGVDLDPAQGKTFYYKDQSGFLFVRATEKELNLIEAYIAKNTVLQPQVNIKTRWVEIPQRLVTPAWLNAASNAFFRPLSNSEIHSSLLTEQEMADVRHRIERRDGIELLSEGQVTTLTERQAQISVQEVRTVATGINPKALTKPGVISTNEDASAYIDTKLTPLGPVFEVLPTVSADQKTISLHMVSTLTEFLGYYKAAKDIPIYVNGKKTKTTLPLPKYRVRQTTNDIIVPDGRTLILGNFPVTETAKQPNGEMRTNDVTSVQTNLLFILVTPTIIDPAGNRAKPATILNR